MELCLSLAALETAVTDDSITALKMGANKQLDNLASDYFNWRLELEPEWSTSLGIYKHNDKLESWNYRDFETRKNRAQEFLDQLMSIKTSDLDKTHMVSYAILKDVLTTYIDGYQWWKFQPLNPFTFLEGFVTYPKKLIAVTPFNTQGDFLNFIIRIEKMPQQFDEMMEAARLAIQYNHTLSSGSVNRIPCMIDELIANESTFPLLEPFLENKAPIVLGESLQIMTERTKAAIKKLILKLKEIKSFIENQYMPYTRKICGILGWENGAQNYRDTLRWHTSLNVTPEEVHQKGLDEVDRIHQQMIKVMGKLGFKGSVRDCFTTLKGNPDFLLTDPEAPLQRYRDIIFQRIMPELPKYFKNLPNLPIVVKHSSQDGVRGEYEPGSKDGMRPGTFYANVRRPEDNPTFSMVSMTLHETVPGHHLAESYSLVSDLPPFRKHMNWRAISAPFYFPFFNSYAEGWALYAEFLGEEMGIYRDDFELRKFCQESTVKERGKEFRASILWRGPIFWKAYERKMGRYSDEIVRACRLVVDTGLHYYGWDRERAIEYVVNYTGITREAAVIDIDRYTTWPGQACGYKMGELKIKELRHKATNELGPLFDLSEFHDIILSNGPMPLGILENLIDNWIRDVKSAASIQ